MNTTEYGVVDDEGLVYAPIMLNREEAIRLSCTLGAGHTPVRRSCGPWEPFNTGIVDPCAPYAR